MTITDAPFPDLSPLTRPANGQYLPTGWIAVLHADEQNACPYCSPAIWPTQYAAFKVYGNQIAAFIPTHILKYGDNL